MYNVHVPVTADNNIYYSHILIGEYAYTVRIVNMFITENGSSHVQLCVWTLHSGVFKHNVEMF